ncbi:cupredoxin domain-containing protein [Acetobacter fabarum]|uniref:cupredoxin domain-containing protein n=1 Tax=Acetobacter fabarum TaxID=483199 RepID=UPI00312BAD0D
MKRLFAALPLLTGMCLFPPVQAQAQTVFHLTLKDHHFEPDHLSVPAGERFIIELENQDSTTDELESYDMKFEKIIVPGSKIRVHAGPLHPGHYTFFDDYHPDQAKGTVTAEAKP